MAFGCDSVDWIAVYKVVCLSFFCIFLFLLLLVTLILLSKFIFSLFFRLLFCSIRVLKKVAMPFGCWCCCRRRYYTYLTRFCLVFCFLFASQAGWLFFCCVAGLLCVCRCEFLSIRCPSFIHSSVCTYCSFLCVCSAPHIPYAHFTISFKRSVCVRMCMREADNCLLL